MKKNNSVTIAELKKELKVQEDKTMHWYNQAESFKYNGRELLLKYEELKNKIALITELIKEKK